MGIEEVKDEQDRGIGNIQQNNNRKLLPIQVQDVTRAPNRHEQNRTYPWHIKVKT
jgi:hypothetical protein